MGSAIEDAAKVGERFAMPSQAFLDLLRDIRLDFSLAQRVPEDKVARLARLAGPDDAAFLLAEVDRLTDADVENAPSDMEDDYWFECRCVARALALMGEPAVKVLHAALRRANWRTRDVAVEALEGIGDPSAVDPLLDRLRYETDAGVLGRLARALRSLDAASPAVDILRARLDGEIDRDVRETVLRALGRLGGVP